MKIDSFETGCARLGLDPNACLPDVSRMRVQDQKAAVASAKLFIICEASREGKLVDWNNGRQYKWYPYFDMEVTKDNPSGFRFWRSVYGYASAVGGLGSRLCYLSEEDADYHGKQHMELYQDLNVIAA